jgi:hypothetical protein
VSCTATDSGGLSDTEFFNVTVHGFGWGGFYQPVDNLPVVNVARSGSSVPVKFNVYGEGGLVIDDVAAIASVSPVKVDCANGATLDTIEVTTSGGTSLRWTGTQFVFNWQTPKQPGTCWRLDVTLQDGSVHSANFALK